MARKVPCIRIQKGKAKIICKALGIGKTTLYAALNFTSHSEDAKLTRKRVLEEYGGIMDHRIIFD